MKYFSVNSKHASSLREMNNTPMQSHSSNNNPHFFIMFITENYVFTILSYQSNLHHALQQMCLMVLNDFLSIVTVALLISDM